jgi:hypothetical protein
MLVIGSPGSRRFNDPDSKATNLPSWFIDGRQQDP